MWSPNPTQYHLHSWASLILPFVEQQTVSNQVNYDVSALDPLNQQAASQVLAVYRCPSYTGSTYSQSPLYTASVQELRHPKLRRDGSDHGWKAVPDSGRRLLRHVEHADHGREGRHVDHDFHRRDARAGRGRLDRRRDRCRRFAPL